MLREKTIKYNCVSLQCNISFAPAVICSLSVLYHTLISYAGCTVANFHWCNVCDVKCCNYIIMEINTYTPANTPGDAAFSAINEFLFVHLEQYGDEKQDIAKAMNYALGQDGKPGGYLLTAIKDNNVIGAVVINKTGMNGYIPDNILVYIATHNEQRGKGVGKKLMQEAIAAAEGDIALHVEPDNPAKLLYEKLGFTNKYLEMRLKK